MTDITSVEIYLRTFYRFEKNLENIDSRFARGQFFLKKDKNNLFFFRRYVENDDSHLARGYKISRGRLEFDFETFFFLSVCKSRCVLK